MSVIWSFLVPHKQNLSWSRVFFTYLFILISLILFVLSLLLRSSQSPGRGDSFPSLRPPSPTHPAPTTTTTGGSTDTCSPTPSPAHRGARLRSAPGIFGSTVTSSISLHHLRLVILRSGEATKEIKERGDIKINTSGNITILILHALIFRITR